MKFYSFNIYFEDRKELSLQITAENAKIAFDILEKTVLEDYPEASENYVIRSVFSE